MKKNVMMRVASALLVAVLMTTCAISGTFAKYTTADSTEVETARVAKWGVNVEAIGENAFKANYEDGDVVSVDSTTKVVAPGTEGTLGGITIDGTPEVKVNVKVTADLTLTGWIINTDEVYCPIVFKVGNETIQMGGDIDTLDKLEKAVEDKFTALSAENVAANTSLNAKDVSVSWAWAFSTTGNDAKDTALGNLAPAPTISFTCSVEVTQVGD